MAPRRGWLWIAGIALLAAAAPETAQADCARNGDSILCTSVDGNGFVSADTNLRLTINPGAFVRNVPSNERVGFCPLSLPVVQVGGNSRVENKGEIRGFGVCGFGIAAGSGATIINDGVINTLDILGIGIVANDNARITHNGAITTVARTSDGILADDRAIITVGGGASIATAGSSASAVSAGDLSAVTNGGTLTTTEIDSHGIELGGDSQASNAGTITVTGPRSVGIRIEGGTVSAVNSGIITATPNRLVAVGERGSGVFLGGVTATLTNSGAITGAHAAVRLAPTRTGRITNTGTLRGVVDAVAATPGATVLIESVAGAQTRIDNTGRIEAVPGLAALRGGAGIEIIDNSGLILGDVLLGGGNDRISQSGAGRIGGVIDMGDGDDTLNFTMSGVLDNAILGAEEMLMTAGNLAVAADIHILERALVGGGTFAIAANTTFEAPEIISAASGVIGGAGTLRGAVQNAGALAPGFSIGTLNIVGSYTQTASGRLEIEVGAGGNDRLTVTGPATLGGTLALNFAPGTDLESGLSFSIITASQGITGNFAAVTGTGSLFLHPTLAVTQNTLTVTIARLSYADAAETAAQRNLAAMLDRALPNAQGDAAGLADELDALPSLAAATDFFAALAPEAPAAAQTLGVLAGRALAEPFMAAANMESAAGTRAWGRIIDGGGHTRASADAAQFTYDLEGAVAGFDFGAGGGARVGVGLGRVLADADLDLADARADSLVVGAYAATTWAETHFAATAFAGGGDAQSSRTRTTASETLNLRTETGLRTAGLSLLTRREIQFGAAKLVPEAAVHLQKTRVNRIDEAVFLGLETEKSSWNSLRTALGLRAETEIGPLTPHLGAAWLREHRQSAPAIAAQLSGLDDSAFMLTGAAFKRDQINLAAGVSVTLAPGAALLLSYEGAVNDSLAGRRFAAGVMWRW